MCGPLCAIGIAGGLWLSKILGIDDLTLGLWMGALILSVSVQLNKYLIRKGKAFPVSFWLILISSWGLSFLPIWKKLNWQPQSLFCGLPRVISGSLIGMIVLFLSDWLNGFIIKKYHQNKVYFPYQKIIIPIIGLIIISLIIELWGCRVYF